MLAAQPIMYLGSAYMHEDPEVRDQRAFIVTLAAGGLISQGVAAFSPIAHSHPVAKTSKLEGGFETWRNFDLTMIRWMDMFGVLIMDGIEDSRGLAEELRFANRLEKPVWGCAITSVYGVDANQQIRASVVRFPIPAEVSSSISLIRAHVESKVPHIQTDPGEVSRTYAELTARYTPLPYADGR